MAVGANAVGTICFIAVAGVAHFIGMAAAAFARRGGIVAAVGGGGRRAIGGGASHTSRSAPTSLAATANRLNFIIAMLTFREFKAAERYAQSFNPFLIPIYELFLNKIAKSGYFRETEPSRIVHTKYDRLYWGRSGLYGNEGNIFNDYIDCIELTDLTLTLKPKNCKL